MAIRLSTGEIVNPLDAVTTPTEILASFPEISRGALRNWMMKDKFAWVQIRRTVIINRDSFLDFYQTKSPNGLDIWFISR